VELAVKTSFIITIKEFAVASLEVTIEVALPTSSLGFA
jgi:hypothetical protein